MAPPIDLRVLVIDDSLTIRAMLEQILNGLPNCRVVGIASDVAAARMLMERDRPNLITLDLMMPGIGGLDFLDELASRAHCPIVVVSSTTKDGTPAADEALARGADACFDKAKIVSEAPAFLALLRKIARKPISTPEARVVDPAAPSLDD
jgi:chemotaxis response regulator CheB